jgi:small-conductance mechanosensitive channel
VVGGLLTAAVFDFDLENAPANSLRLMTTAGQILFILLPALLLTQFIYKDVTEVIRVRAPNWIEVLLFIIGILLLSPLLQSYLYIQNFLIEQLADKFYLVRDLKELVDSLNSMMEKSYSSLIRTDNFAEVSWW